MAYLSNNNTANPNFCAPTNSFGTITYTVTTNNACGETSSSDVVINYDTNPNNSPFVTISNIAYSDIISFDIAMNAHSEDIKIELYDNNTNTLINTYNLKRGVDFSCCSFTWTIPDYFVVCNDLKLKVSSRNMCSEVWSPITTIIWPRNPNITVNLFPNIFTPPNPPNEQLCIGVSNAQSYTITALRQDGSTCYTGSGSVNGNNVCVWDGYCSNGNLAPGGTYYIILNFYNNYCGTSLELAQFITLLHDNIGGPNGKKGNDNTSKGDSTKTETKNPIENKSAELSITSNVRVYPNPSSGIVNVDLYNLNLTATEISVFNYLGEKIVSKNTGLEFHNSIDLFKYADGWYCVKIMDVAKQEIYTHRVNIIKNK